LLEVESVSHNSGLSGDSIQRVVQSTVTEDGQKSPSRLFSRLEARVFRPAMAMFTANDAVLPFPLRPALDRVDTQLDRLIYDALPLPKAS
jgi:hypothetical protein